MISNNTTNSKQAAWVAIGSLFSFIVGIVSPMILSRYFDKGDYGTYKQVMYVYNTLLAVFTLGLPKAYAYFLPKYEPEFSKDIISKVTRIFFVLGAIFSLCMFVFAGGIANAMNNDDLKIALRFFSPTPFFLLPTMGLDAIYAAFRKTQFLAYYTIITKVLTIVCIVLPVVIFSGNFIHAIIGFDIASFVTFLLAIYLKEWPVKVKVHRKSDLTYKEIFRFSIPLLYASLWGIVFTSVTQFFISRYYGNETFGEFSNGFMELPFVGMIIGAISAVLLPVFSGMDKGDGMNDETLTIWNSALLKSAKLIFPMLIFSIFFARLLMTCMYGDMYANSATYFMIKNISGLTYIIPFYPIILAIGKTKDYAKVHMIIAIMAVIIEYIICKTSDSPIFVAIASEVCTIIKIYLLMRIIAHYAQKKIANLIQPFRMLKIMAIAVCASFPPFVILRLIETNKFIALGIAFALFMLDYFILCFIFRVTYKDILGSFLVNKSKLKCMLRFIP